MASIVYNNALAKLIDGSIDLNTDDIRAALVMSNTTADTEKDSITAMNSFSTLDECDDTSYSRVALANEAVNTDNTNDRAEFDADDLSFTSLAGNSSRNVVGCVLYKHVTDDTDSIPIVFVEFSSALSSSSTQIDVPWNAEGILQLAQA